MATCFLSSAVLALVICTVVSQKQSWRVSFPHMPVSVKTGNGYPSVFLSQIGFNVPLADAMTFHVQACSGAQLVFIGSYGQMVADVVLGGVTGTGSSVSYIRPCIPPFHPDIPLDCSPSVIVKTFRLGCWKDDTLWVSWRSDVINVGYGSVPGLNPFMDSVYTGRIVDILVMSQSYGKWIFCKIFQVLFYKTISG